MKRSRIDSNQSEIVRLIRQVPGWTWLPIPNARGLSQRRLGDGLLRAGWWPRGLVLHVEIKTSKGKLRPEQEKATTRGETVVVRSFDDVQDAMDMAARLVGHGPSFTDRTPFQKTTRISEDHSGDEPPSAA